MLRIPFILTNRHIYETNLAFLYHCQHSKEKQSTCIVQHFTKQLIPDKTDSSSFLSKFQSQKQPSSFPSEYIAIPKEAKSSEKLTIFHTRKVQK